MALRVLHLVGSPVSNFFAELSRLYADDCLRSTNDPMRYHSHIAYVAPDGRWRFPTDLSANALSTSPAVRTPEAVRRIEDLGIDVMVPQMFCRPGMTTYRALFDLLGVPYVGNRPAVMAIGADKAQARAIVAAAGVDIPVGEVLTRGQHPSIPPPAVVKPVNADNSAGVSLVRTRAQYPAALAAAFTHADAVLVENYIELGREVRCGMVQRHGNLAGLPLEEYALGTNGIRGPGDKLGRGSHGQLALMAKTDSTAWIVDPHDPITRRVQTVAAACHAALGCRHHSLFDFRIDPSGRPWFLEAGLYCSFARQSVIVTMARAAGISVQDLFSTSVELTMTEQ